MLAYLTDLGYIYVCVADLIVVRALPALAVYRSDINIQAYCWPNHMLSSFAAMNY